MSRKTHSYLMVGLLAVGAVLFFSGGVGGGALLLLRPVLCMEMIAMMWFMGGMASGPAQHTHDDGVAHSHADASERSHR